MAGGAAALFPYLLVALAGHRIFGISNTVPGYTGLLPRALPELVAGFAFWVFLFVPFLTPLRPMLLSLFVA